MDTFHEVMVEGSGASIDTLKGQYGFDVSILSKEPLSKIFTDQAFVDMCMRSSSKNWSKIAETLYQRYDHTGDKSSKDEWMKEKDWIRNVCDQLRQKISELDTKESNLRKAQLTYWLKDAEDKLVNH